MGNSDSICKGFFGNSAMLHKSSLNLKYVQEKRNTISSKKQHQRTSSGTSSTENTSHKHDIEDQSTRASKKRYNISLDDFSLLKVVGRGSYGKIYLAQKKSNKKYYALKTIKKQDLMRGNLRQTVFTERDVLMNSHHPFIVNLKSSFQTELRIYMVLEFCQGGELYLHLRRQGKFDEHTVRFYAAEVILALQYLHEELNIIHRDLKPENILVNIDGHIKVTDFGLAKVSNKAHSVCGTPEYLAPEIILRQNYGKAIDWWSLGCLMYEMAVGYPPFSSKDREELNDDIILKSPDMPEGMSEDLEDLIFNLLSKDPKARLGAKGADQVKKHPFFKDINWDEIYEKKPTPPYLPVLNGIDDMSHFHKTYVNEPVHETPLPKNQILDDPKNDFHSFSYLDDTFVGMSPPLQLNEKEEEEEEEEGSAKEKVPEKFLDLEFEKD